LTKSCKQQYGRVNGEKPETAVQPLKTKQQWLWQGHGELEQSSLSYPLWEEKRAEITESSNTGDQIRGVTGISPGVVLTVMEKKVPETEKNKY